MNRLGNLRRQQDRARLHSLKISLAEVVSDAGQMIHVAVADAEHVAGDRKLRPAAYVEADVQFGDLKNRFFARDAESNHRQRPELQPAELLGQVGSFRNLGQRSHCSATVGPIDRLHQTSVG